MVSTTGSDRRASVGWGARAVRLLVALALAIGVLPTAVAANAWAASSCVGGSVQFSAHEDDDLLFMSPDIISDLSAGKCIRTVYVTAGDAGNESDYWESREKGSEAAWASMAGVSNSWTTSTISAGGKTLRVRTLTAKPTVSLVFMRLPDGMLYGDGSDSAGSSVYRLMSGTISTLKAKDSSASYTSTTLKNTMLDILRISEPTLVRSQNYNGSYVTTGTSFDHWDHVAIAKVVLTVSTAYASEKGHQRVAYMGYPTQYKSANVTGTLLSKKSTAFDVYADYDDEVDLDTYYDYYGWPARQYTTATGGSSVAASAGADQTVTAGTTVTLDASGSYASSSMTYAWSLTSGPASVTLSSSTAAKPTFTPTTAGSYIFKLTVTSGGTTSTDSVTIVVTAAGATNLALASGVTATASSAASGQGAAKVIDGSTLGYPTDSTKEWASSGGKAGSWVKLTFPSAVTIDTVVLYDRPNTNDQIKGCTLTFSDGSTVTCPSALDNAGGATTITFTSRSTTSILLTITSVSSSTENIGLAEFQVFGSNASTTASATATASASASASATATATASPTATASTSSTATATPSSTSASSPTTTTTTTTATASATPTPTKTTTTKRRR